MQCHKKIKCFDKKKSICIEYNSRKVKCEYCPYIIRCTGLGIHVKNSRKDIDSPEGIEPEYYKYYFIVPKIKAKGVDVDKLLED